MKVYKTNYRLDFIEEIEIIRETEKCIYIKNTRTGKEERIFKASNWCIYHKTYSDAKDYLFNKVNDNIADLKNELEDKCEQLKVLEKL